MLPLARRGGTPPCFDWIVARKLVGKKMSKFEQRDVQKLVRRLNLSKMTCDFDPDRSQGPDVPPPLESIGKINILRGVPPPLKTEKS